MPRRLAATSRTLALALVAGVLLKLAAEDTLASERRAGDVLATALPLASLATEVWRGDAEGAKQQALVFVISAGSAEVLKRTTGVERPDKTNDLSFPSGHAARAFSSAAFVRARHGLMPSLPWYAAALYVGHTRVEARRHRWGDVLGAALLSEAVAHAFVTPAKDSQRTWALAIDDEGVALQFAARW